MSSAPLLFTSPYHGPLTGGRNNTWLLDGDEPTLVDAGGAAEHVDTLAAHLGTRPLVRVLVTHGHLDHAGGVPGLRARWPGVEALKFPADGEAGWLPLADGQVVRAGSTSLTVLHTPGHAPDHVAFWHEETRAIFAGDMVIAGTTVMIPGSRGGNLREYLQSLDRLIALEPTVIYPGHGAVIDRPVALMQAYIRHRIERERQVRACLARGLTDAAAIVASIYGPIDPTLSGAAAETVRAHIQKIREDEAGLLD